MTAVTGAVLSAWAAFSVERGGARPGSPPRHPRSPGALGESGPSPQPVRTCLSRPEFPFLTAATRECFRGDGAAGARGDAETKRAWSQVPPGAVLASPARIPSPTLTGAVGGTRGRCAGGAAVAARSSEEQGAGKGVGFPALRVCRFLRFCVSPRAPVHAPYFSLCLFEPFKRRRPPRIARPRHLRAKPV